MTTEMTSLPSDELRRTLFQLRRRQGPFAHKELWLSETARLRSMLRAGSAELAAFEAIEVQGLTFKAAAAQLGFSERHLYRVRHSMREQLCTSPQQHITVQPPPAVEREIEMAAAMLHRGHSDAVLPLVERALDSPASPASVVEALTLRARSLCNLEDFSGARKALTEAHRYVNSIGGESMSPLARDVFMAYSYDLYRRGMYDKAIETAENALAGAKPAHVTNPYAVRGLARQLIFLSLMHQEGGSPHASLKHLDTARDILNTLPAPPAAELAQIAFTSAFSRAAIPGEYYRARLDAHEALQRAEWNGLVYETIWANLAVTMIEEVGGRPQAGLVNAHAALALARTAFCGDPLARTLFLTSRVESAAGLHEDSLSRLRDAEPHVGQIGLMRAIIYVAQARAFRDAGYVDETITAATNAISALESKSQSHYIGIGYLARARARHSLADVRARTDTEAAIYYLERGGSVRDLSIALELSYAQNGNRAHYERARELRIGA